MPQKIESLLAQIIPVRVVESESRETAYERRWQQYQGAVERSQDLENRVQEAIDRKADPDIITIESYDLSSATSIEAHLWVGSVPQRRKLVLFGHLQIPYVPKRLPSISTLLENSTNLFHTAL